MKKKQEKLAMPEVSKTEGIDVQVSPAAKDTLQMAATQAKTTSATDSPPS